MMNAFLASVGTANPPSSYDQEQVYRLAGYQSNGVRRIFKNAAIDRRHLALEHDHVLQEDPDWFSRHYEQWAPRLALEAARRAMERAGITASDVDYLVATSCTGYLCPGLATHVAAGLSLSPRVKSANLVGMGCSAAVPALERAAEFVGAHPGATALVVAAEVGSAAYWIDESDLETVVGNALFSDGAAAAVVTSDESLKSRAIARFKNFATRSNRDMMSEMGFRQQAGRLRVHLSREVPLGVLTLADGVISELLAEEKQSPSDVAHWILHPGGRRILDLAEERWHDWAMKGRLTSSREVLRRFGNMSSATVLFVLEETLQKAARPQVGDQGLLIAMGPGLTVEGCLLQFS